MKIPRILESLIGIVFIVGAALKGIDFFIFAKQIEYYRIIQGEDLIKGIAFGVIVLEALLGLGLLTGIGARRGWTQYAVLAMLLGFTGLLTYSWIFKDLKDCGCFGSFLKMTPGVSIAKNVVMMGILTLTLVLRRKRPVPEFSTTGDSGAFIGRLAASACTGVVVITCLAYGLTRTDLTTQVSPDLPVYDPDRPFTKFQVEWDSKTWDLGSGDYFIGMLSDSCEHCEENIQRMNDLAESFQGILPVAALCLGEEQTFTELKARTNPQFPMKIIPPLDFFDLIGDFPPRFYYVREGKAVKFWDETIPEDDEIILITSPSRTIDTPTNSDKL